MKVREIQFYVLILIIMKVIYCEIIKIKFNSLLLIIVIIIKIQFYGLILIIIKIKVRHYKGI